MADIIVILLVASTFFAAVGSVIKHKRISRCGGCGGNCESCGKCKYEEKRGSRQK